MLTYIKGLDTVLDNLGKEVQRMAKASMKGLVTAVNMIEYETDSVPPLVPIDLGNLRASFFRDPRYTATGPVVRFGYTAAYAWWVHENVGATFQRPGAGAKWLEAAIKRNEERILMIIQGAIVKEGL